HGDAPGFHGIALLHDGYLVIPRAGTCCSGGGVNFYDISNPYAPALGKRIDEPTPREGPATGATYFHGRKYLVTLASHRVHFWDWTDIDNPALLRRMILPGIQPSDYDLGAWWLTWAGRYVYVSGAGNGLYIVDATDPANPTLRRRISNADLGTSFRTGSSFVVGNLLVINMNDSNGFATFDLSDPGTPVLRARATR